MTLNSHLCRFISDVEDNKELFFIFNNFDHVIDVIDLNKLEYTESYRFSKEGPDGTGEYINGIQALNDSFFFIKSFHSSGIFNKNGKLFKKINWSNSVNEENLTFSGYLKSEVMSFYETTIVMGLNFDQFKKSVHLDVLSTERNSFNRYQIDPDSSYSNYILTVNDPNDYSFFDPWVYMNKENNLILISHDFSNEISVLSFEGKYVKTVRYQPNLTKSKVSYNNEYGLPSHDHLRTTYLSFFEQVSFGPLVWDDTNKRYLRLSSSKKYSKITRESDFYPDVINANVYLSLFDSSLNFIQDYHLTDLTSCGEKYFVKDGNLWLVHNFSDELGFIVVDFID
jgi:hypothetical protein